MTHGPPNTLVEFILRHCTVLPNLIMRPDSTEIVDYSQLQCPICLSTILESEGVAVQVNIGNCRHIFDVECLSAYAIANFNRCPMCRITWFRALGSSQDATPEDGEAAEHLRLIHYAILQLRIILNDEDNVPDELWNEWQRQLELESGEASSPNRSPLEYEDSSVSSPTVASIGWPEFPRQTSSHEETEEDDIR
ncbi:hypothetical protein BDV96DRAFT_651158 [Lophiotrema nucula]|uniref:RING-type domain-containing protein n=1 Tax=Lophiotrema nucula TaxID=690887 RepID=A0A6A5YVF1_9PLEO|nr:hypothetical protein BDV96DRAFT_651158 [Lophiotrema nucula]